MADVQGIQAVGSEPLCFVWGCSWWLFMGEDGSGVPGGIEKATFAKEPYWDSSMTKTFIFKIKCKSENTLIEFFKN